ncbi:unnamed protein product [Calicophoron daubneyi]|uniref:Frizzled-8 n=1 Tax=Calicophoron daubneyi TaxID=300641 RepID=A0AAV2U168_CALDB
MFSWIFSPTRSNSVDVYDKQERVLVLLFYISTCILRTFNCVQVTTTQVIPNPPTPLLQSSGVVKEKGSFQPEDDYDQDHWNPEPFHEIVGGHMDTKKYRCEPVTLGLCKGMYYQYTRMPNIFHHETQEEAGLEAHQFYPLVQINCSEDLRFLLCSIYTPICIKNYPHFLPPCRSICERVKAGCAPTMQHYGFPWPERMSCSQFPDYNNPEGILCMERNLTEAESTVRRATSTPSIIPQSMEKTVAEGRDEESVEVNTDDRAAEEVVADINEEAADVLLKATMRNQTVQILLGDQNDIELKCKCSCRPPLIPIRNGQADKISTSYLDNCQMSCRSPYFHSESVSGFTNFWLMLWTILCAVSTFVTVMTFFLDSCRFQYPELPIIYLSTCYFMISVGYLIRIIAGHNFIACDSMEADAIGQTSISVTDSLLPDWTLESSVGTDETTALTTLSSMSTNKFVRLKVLRYATTGRVSCAAVFLFTYFFGMASSVWWVILTFTWVLAAGMKWGTEAISKYSQVFHFVAWSIPTAMTALALLLAVVEGDPESGLCTIRPTHRLAFLLFSFVPTLIFLTTGLIFVAVGFVALFRIRGAIKLQGVNMGKTDRLENLMTRIGVFGLLYAIPNIIVLICNAYELRDSQAWEYGIACQCKYAHSKIPVKSSHELGSLPEWTPPKPDYTMFMLKHFMSLIIGITSGFWIWSHKTVDTWKHLCQNRCLRTHSRRNGRLRLLPNPAVAEQDASSKLNFVPWQQAPSATSIQTALPQRGGDQLFGSEEKVSGLNDYRGVTNGKGPVMPLPPIPAPSVHSERRSVQVTPFILGRRPGHGSPRVISGSEVGAVQPNESHEFAPSRKPGGSPLGLQFQKQLQTSLSTSNGLHSPTRSNPFPTNWSVLSSSGIGSGFTGVGGGTGTNVGFETSSRHLNSNSAEPSEANGGGDKANSPPQMDRYARNTTLIQQCSAFSRSPGTEASDGRISHVYMDTNRPVPSLNVQIGASGNSQSGSYVGCYQSLSSNYTCPSGKSFSDQSDPTQLSVGRPGTGGPQSSMLQNTVQLPPLFTAAHPYSLQNPKV